MTIGGGTLQVGNNDGNGGLGTGPVTDNGALVFSRTNSSLTDHQRHQRHGHGGGQCGTGMLNLSGANTFDRSGDGGRRAAILQSGNNSALGTTNGGTTIANGASLDVFAHNVGQEPIFVSGIGVTNGDGSTNGAIYNSGRQRLLRRWRG